MKNLLAVLISSFFITAAYAQTSTTPAQADAAQGKEAVSVTSDKSVKGDKKDASKAKKTQKKSIKKTKAKAKIKTEAKEDAGKSTDAKATSKKKDSGKEKGDAVKPAKDVKGTEAAK